MGVEVKICGIISREALDASVAGGARWIGFNFYPPSPRAIDPQTAAALKAQLPGAVEAVAVLVDPDDALIDSVLPAVDILQLHGEESPARLAAIAARTGKPLWKAVAVAEPADLDRAMGYREVAQAILFDAKPRPGALLPGGNGLAFDAALMRHVALDRPWLLSGGLTPDRLPEAVEQSGAGAVDVSSGVESRRGVKDPGLIKAFLKTAKSL